MGPEKVMAPANKLLSPVDRGNEDVVKLPPSPQRDSALLIQHAFRHSLNRRPMPRNRLEQLAAPKRPVRAVPGLKRPPGMVVPLTHVRAPPSSRAAWA